MEENDIALNDKALKDGFAITGDCSTGITIDANGTANNETIELKGKGGYDQYIIGYNNEGKVIWSQVIGSSGREDSTGIIEVEGKYIVVGGFSTSITIPAENTEYGESISIKSNGSNDLMLITINENGLVESASNFGSTGKDLLPEAEYNLPDIFHLKFRLLLLHQT